ncbi:MAG: hypothetical protein IH596_15450 [Bacteroidales bacterium]|nr:hypothetical protein [Bacteroidales bacterium]
MARGILIFGLFLVWPFYLLAQTLVVSNDTTICIGGTASLVATPGIGGYGTDSYTFQIIPYAPEAYSGGTGITFNGNGDDQIAGPFDIGFSFCFFNQYYTQFYVGSNGWIGFTYNAAWTTFSPTALPNAANSVPKNCIMAPWQDWYPGNGGTFTPPYVFYKVVGTAPFRKLIVYWLDCPMYGCLATRGKFQIVLNEHNSIVENHLTNKPYCAWQNNGATQGVHNATGTVAFTATGRNFGDWTASNESTRFVPSGVKWYVGGYPGGTIVGYGQTLDISPTDTTTYTAVVETCGGGGDAWADVIVNVIDPAFTYPSNAYCHDDANPVPSFPQSGGIFSSSPPGLVLVSTITGEIDIAASSPGTYTITRTINVPCTVAVSHPMTINPLPSAPTPSAPLFFRCGPGDITVEVVPQPNETYWWFDAAIGGIQYPSAGSNLTIPVTSTITVFAEAHNTLTQCVSSSRTPVLAEVRPVPDVTNSTTAFQICSGEQASIALLSSIPGSTFSWDAAGSSPLITGFSNGSGDQIVQVLTNADPDPQTATYTVTATLNQCPSNPLDFVVTVSPVANVIFTPNAQSICSGYWTGIGLSSTSPGVTYSWLATGTAGISGFTAGAGILIQQKLSNSGYFPGFATYTVTPTIGTCTGIAATVPVTVLPSPQVTLRRCVDTVTTTQAVPISLKGGIPLGGQYSGPGVNSATGIFSPVAAGSGVHKLYYSYTNLHGCLKKDSVNITVQTPLPFQCGDTLTDIRDSRNYPTVLIGSQCWMAANLNVGTRISGSQSQRDNCIVEKYCYNNDPALCALGSVLYQWDEVMAYQAQEMAQGICPAGWHIPSEGEWIILFNNFINNGFAGNALKSSGYSGFNALLTGIRFENRSWKFPSTDGTLRSTLFWSSTLGGSSKAWAHGMNEVADDIEYTPSVSFYPALISNGFAVRCIRD